MDTALPYSKDAEHALIGSVLIDPSQFIEIDLEPEEFYITRNRFIWEAIGGIVKRGHTPDFVVVCEELERREHMAEIGGQAYLMQLMSHTPTSLHAGQYADIIREKAKRRDLILLASDMARAANDDKLNLEQKTPEFIQRIADASRLKRGAVHISNFVSELYDEVDERSKDPKEIWGIETGFPIMDRVTGGLQPGEIMLLSGKPGLGKSIYVMQMACQLAEHSPGAVYSLEMTGRAITRRMVSSIGKIPTRNMKTGRMSETDWPLFTNAVEKLSSLPVYMDANDGWTTTSLRADLARLKAQHGVKWFVLDYMFLLKDGLGLDDTARTTMMAEGLKSIVRGLDLTAVVVHSMNKAGMAADMPQQENLGGSARVPYSGDIVVFINDFMPFSNAEKEFKSLHDPEYLSRFRTLTFGKGRELENPKKYIHLEKKDTFPAFEERTFTDEPDAPKKFNSKYRKDLE